MCHIREVRVFSAIQTLRFQLLGRVFLRNSEKGKVRKPGESERNTVLRPEMDPDFKE